MLGQITKWIQQAGAAAAQAYNFGYDPVSQLKGATLKDPSQAVLRSYTYDYDGAGNRTMEAIDSLVTGDTLNNLNQLTTRQGGTGVMPIRGTTNEPSTVTVNGNPAAVKADNSFEGKAAVTAGDNTVTVVATDTNGNTTTNRYNVAVSGSGGKTLVYDANGNLTGDGTRTFEWDPLNRLTAVTSGMHRSEFTYNGLSQRVKIVEKDNGAVTSTKQFVWVPGAAQPAEERDGSNNVTKRFYAQGEQIGSINYYYTRDHLGSVRELTDSSGVIQTRYDYDPYGRRTRLTGTLDADFGFTGHYYHQPSALSFTLYRAYDADLGRWISRDWIGEDAGINLYEYVGNSTVDSIDPLGLIDLNLFAPGDRLATSIQRAPDPANVYTVGVHGSNRSVSAFSDPTLHTGMWLSPEDLARKILSDPNFSGNTAVQLYSCNTGNPVGQPRDFGPFRNSPTKKPFAQELADLLGVPVIAPDNFLWISPSGSAFIGPPVDSHLAPSNWTANHSSPGHWIAYLPH